MGLPRRPRRSPPAPAANGQPWQRPPKRRLIPSSRARRAVRIQEQREYLRQAVLKRMKPLDALDAELFLAVNHLPHNRWLNGFFRFFTLTFSAGLGWYVMMALAILVDPRRGIRVVRHTILPLSVASILVEYPIKAFFRRSRPFIDFIQAIVIGKKPGSWSFPSGHSASAFAGAWLLSRDFPGQRPFSLPAGRAGRLLTHLPGRPLPRRCSLGGALRYGSRRDRPAGAAGGGARGG